MDLAFDQWMQKMKQNQADTGDQAPRSYSAASSMEVSKSDLEIAYVARNPDGSFTQFKMTKTAMKAVWTTVIAETQSSQTSITDIRLASLDQWVDPQVGRKRVVFARAARVQPNECMKRLMQRNPIENPVLLVCWERPPAQWKKTNPSPHVHNKAMCCRRKEWHYILFTNSTKACSGKPIIIVTTATDSQPLYEEGIDTIASCAFVNWITQKVRTEKWEIISLTKNSASARVKLDVPDGSGSGEKY